MNSPGCSEEPQVNNLMRYSKYVWKFASTLLKIALRIGRLLCRGILAFVFTIKQDLGEQESSVQQPGCEQMNLNDAENTIKSESTLTTEACKVEKEFEEIVNEEKDGLSATGGDIQNISKKKKKIKNKVTDQTAQKPTVSKNSEQMPAKQENTKAENVKKKNVGNTIGAKTEGVSKSEIPQKAACENNKKEQKKQRKTAQNSEEKAAVPVKTIGKKPTVVTTGKQNDTKGSCKTNDEQPAIRTPEIDSEHESAIEGEQKETRAAQITSNMSEASETSAFPPLNERPTPAMTCSCPAKDSIPALMDIPITSAWGDLSCAGFMKQKNWSAQNTTSIQMLTNRDPISAWGEQPALTTATQSTERDRNPILTEANPWARGSSLKGSVFESQGEREDIAVSNSPTPEEAAELTFQEVGRKWKQKESKQQKEAEKSQLKTSSRVSPASSLGSMEGVLVPKKSFKKQVTLEGNGPALAVGKPLPKRPDRGGRIGNAITVHVNCWEARIADMTVYMYDIEALKLFKIVDGKKNRNEV
uniref:Uncharacterized protein n=1 Tax=Schistocephalus solidus TaxID=70667 RepID=A0A0X3P872_SCHSO